MMSLPILRHFRERNDSVVSYVILRRLCENEQAARSVGYVKPWWEGGAAILIIPLLVKIGG
jgi:hypothetical protein